jgi:adenine phosphoribosyltransferase
MTLEDKLRSAIRDVPDFPKKGIVFKDISTIMLNPKLSNEVLEAMVAEYKDKDIDAVAGIESRGFLFGLPLALRLGIPFVLVRKEGKLPFKKISHAYQLEYGSATIEMHIDAISKGTKVLIHDDLLATGGSAEAAAHLIEKCGGKVFGFNFLVSLDFLDGHEKLKSISSNIVTFARY